MGSTCDPLATSSFLSAALARTSPKRKTDPTLQQTLAWHQHDLRNCRTRYPWGTDKLAGKISRSCLCCGVVCCAAGKLSPNFALLSIAASNHHRLPSRAPAFADASQPQCQNCTTSTTPLWRRDETGSVLCNACGLFLKLHGRPRPISLKTDVIKSRNRVKAGGPGSRKKV